MFEANFSFYVRQCTMGRVQFSLSGCFVLVLAKLSFCVWGGDEGDWALGYNSMKFREFFDIF